MIDSLRGVALRLQGPLQSWGGPSVGDDRPTLPFPTRSGVLGLVGACMGILRSEQTRLLDLARGARVHVRVDAPGSLLVDDQTIQGHPAASETRQTIQSKRSYLCDASFTVIVVPGPSVSVESIVNAVRMPVFSPFLGRRHCVPSTPLLLAPEVIADDPLDLFADLPRGSVEFVGDASAHPDLDHYLDVTDHARRLRRIVVRDDLAGPLGRQFRERTVVHVRAPGPRPSA